MPKINFLSPTLALALIASLLLAAYQCSERKNDLLGAASELSTVKSQDAAKQVIIDTLEAQIKRTASARAVDKEKFKVSQNAKDSQIKGYQKQLASIRPQVVVISDSLPIIARFVELHDSTVLAFDSLTASLRKENSALYESFTKELKLSNEKYLAASEQSKMWEQATVKGNKELKKQRGWTRFWRAVGIGAASAAVVLAITSQ